MWDYIFTTPSEVMATIASTDAVLSHLHKGSMGYILIFSILFLRNWDFKSFHHELIKGFRRRAF